MSGSPFRLLANLTCLLLTFIFLAYPPLASSQTPSPANPPARLLANPQVFTTQDGLISNYITALALSPDGALWVGTTRGLNRYNGVEWETFTTRTTDGQLPSNDISAIMVDHQGNLWFGTFDAGVVSYSPNALPFKRWHTYTTQDGLNSDRILALMEARDGQVWAGTDAGFSLFNGKRWSGYHLSQEPDADRVRALLQAQNGDVWLGTRAGLAICTGASPRACSFVDELGPIWVLTLYQDRQERIWVGTEGNGLWMYDGTSWHTYTKSEGLADNEITAIAQDPTGRLWFGTAKGGISVYDGSAWHTLTVDDGLPSNSITAILADETGTLWFGTGNPRTGAGYGLVSYTEQGWASYRPPAATLPNLWITAILEDSRGDLWVGFDGGVSHYDRRASVWHTYTKADGLVANYVTSLAEDKEGIIWVGLSDNIAWERGGLNWFDGQSWHSHTFEDLYGDNRSNQVTSLLVSSDGSLWVGTYGGIHHYKREGQQTISAVQEPETALSKGWDISPAPQISETGTRGGIRYPGDENWRTYTIQDGLPDDCVLDIAEGPPGTLWFATCNAGLLRFNLLGWKVFADTSRSGLLTDNLGAVLIGRDNSIWIAGMGGYAGRYRQGEWMQWPGPAEGRFWVPSLCEDRMTRLWLGMGSEYSGEGEGVRYYAAGRWHDAGLEGLGISSLYEDHQGVLWAGTFGEGLWYYDGHLWHPFAWPTELGDNRVLSILVDRDGRWWFGTDGGGLSLYDGTSWHTFTVHDGLGSNYILDLLQDSDGHIWAATGNPYIKVGGGVSRFDPSQMRWQTFTAADGLASKLVWVLFEDRDGTLWAGGAGGERGGLNRHTDQGWEPYPVPGLVKADVTAIAQDDEGALWVATEGEGVFRIQGETVEHFTVEDGLASDTVLSVLVDSDGVVWLGTKDGGLSRYHDGTWQTFTVADGLGSNCIASIVEDPYGTLWLAHSDVFSSCKGGVTRYDGKRWRVFNSANSGLPDDYVHTVALTPEGHILFGTDLWFTRYIPSTHPPQVRIDRIITLEDNKTYESPRSVLIPYNRDTIRIEFSARDLPTRAKDIAYRYKLEGWDPTWNTLENRLAQVKSDYVEYADLQPAHTYTFYIAAGNALLDYSLPVSFTLTVQDYPLWLKVWQAEWFRIALILLALVGAPLGAFGYRWWRMQGAFRYRDLEVVVEPGTEPGAYRVCFRSPRLKDGLDVETTLDLDLLEDALIQVERGHTNEPLLRYIGSSLYEALFPGAIPYNLRRRVGLGRRPVRLRMSFEEAPELAGLPWELMYGGERVGFLAQRADTALVRYAPPPEEIERPGVGRKLRILVVMAQPADERVPELGLAEEKKRLDAILGGMPDVELGYLFGFHAAQLVGETPLDRDLPDLLAERLGEGWDVLHFVGHAGPDLMPFMGEAEIVLWCEDRRGDYLALGPEELEVMLRGLASEGKVPKLVVLSACRTADVESRLVKVMLEAGVMAVVGMQWPVLDVAARAFAEGFYSTLPRHGQVDYAVSVARNRMAQEVGLSHRDWAAPVLVMQTAEGFIFERV